MKTNWKLIIACVMAVFGINGSAMYLSAGEIRKATALPFFFIRQEYKMK